MSKLIVARALTARFARRIVRIVTVAAVIALTALFVGVWLLAHFFSTWWWLLLIPVLLLAGVFLIVRLIAWFILSRIHVGQLTSTQSEALDAFIEKLEQAIEARATPWPIIALICVKDLILHRDLTTVRRIIKETVGLRRDYQHLETLF